MQWTASATGIAMSHNAVAIADRRESAYGYKQKVMATPKSICCTSDSGLSNRNVGFLTNFVCLTSDSRPIMDGPPISAYDPMRTLCI